MIKQEVKNFLEESGINYEIVQHPASFSAMDEAHSMGVDPDDVVKNLIIKTDGQYFFVAIPGGHRLSSSKEHDILGKHARMINEQEMASDFPDYETGTVPPLGPLFGIPVYIDENILQHQMIMFPAGSHNECFKVNRDDFINVNNAQLVDVTKEFLD